MASHVDPLMERVLSLKPAPGIIGGSAGEGSHEERVGRERGLSLAVLDRIVQEAVFTAREEERIQGKRERAVAQSRARRDGYLAGVAAAVEVLEPDLRGTALRIGEARERLRKVVGLLNEATPGPGLPRQRLGEMHGLVSEAQSLLVGEDDSLSF